MASHGHGDVFLLPTIARRWGNENPIPADWKQKKKMAPASFSTALGPDFCYRVTNIMCSTRHEGTTPQVDIQRLTS